MVFSFTAGTWVLQVDLEGMRSCFEVEEGRGEPNEAPASRDGSEYPRRLASRVQKNAFLRGEVRRRSERDAERHGVKFHL